MDERNKQIALRVVAIMYFLTIIALQAIVIHKQLVLGQDIRDFEEIGIVMLVNTVFLLSALLYFGAIPLQKIRVKSILLFYALIVVLGSLFTWAKYNLIGKQELSLAELMDKLLIIFAVSGLLVLFFVVFALLGKRRSEKDLEA